MLAQAITMEEGRQFTGDKLFRSQGPQHERIGCLNRRLGLVKNSIDFRDDWHLDSFLFSHLKYALGSGHAFSD